MDPEPEPRKEKQPAAQAAAAEYLEFAHRKTGRGVLELAKENCSTGGKLFQFCRVDQLLLWHRVWKRQERAEENFRQSPEIPVDPVAFSEMAAAESAESAEDAGPEGDEIPRAGTADRAEQEIAGGFLEFMDQRLMRAGLRWRESSVALRSGETFTQRMGGGRAHESGGRLVEWVGSAVMIGNGGLPRRVVAEAFIRGLRPAGSAGYRHGAVRLKKAELVRRTTDERATAQAVGTLLLLFRGKAGGLKNQVEVAAATGCTKANISAKARRMAGSVVKAGNKPSFRGLRCKGTVGKVKIQGSKGKVGRAAARPYRDSEIQPN